MILWSNKLMIYHQRPQNDEWLISHFKEKSSPLVPSAARKTSEELYRNQILAANSKKSDELIETVVPQIALTKPMIHKKGKAIKSINESAPEESLTTTGKIVFTVWWQSFYRLTKAKPKLPFS